MIFVKKGKTVIECVCDVQGANYLDKCFLKVSETGDEEEGEELR